MKNKPLRDLLRYDKSNGIFRWKARSSNRIKVGEIAGSKDPTGYILIRACRISYRAHRLAWFFAHGVFPSDEIDHINGNRSDNRIANLRVVNSALNKQNQRKAKSNNKSTGVLGVYPNGTGFMASIQVDRKTHYLGTFPTITLASEAYVLAKRKLHPAGML